MGRIGLEVWVSASFQKKFSLYDCSNVWQQKWDYDRGGFIPDGGGLSPVVVEDSGDV